MLEVIFDLMGIGCALALMVAFVLIKVYGGYMAVEPNTAILFGEIALCLIIVGIGIDRLRHDMKNR